MKRHFLLLAVVLINSLAGMTRIAPEIAENSTKPRIIVTTDGEADDRASMVRFLLSSK